MIFLREGLLRVIGLVHDLILTHLVTHIGITLHVVVDLVGALGDYVHRSCSSRNRVGIGGSGDHRDSIIGRLARTSSPSQNLSNFIFVDGLSLVVEFQLILRSTHAEYLEAIDLRNEFGRTLWKKLRELLQENVWKAGAEIGSIDV